MPLCPTVLIRAHFLEFPSQFIYYQLTKTKEKSMNERTKKTTWTLILKVIITVATALAGALGLNACIG